MKEQITFTEIEYRLRRVTTRREAFLKEMDRLVPWAACVSLIEPVYPAGGHGRKPIGIETMLRMLFLQKWFGLSAKGTEEAIYDSYAMKQFMAIRFDEEQVPDATTLCRFRKLLSDNGLNEPIRSLVKAAMAEARISVRCGSITDAVVVKAPTRKKESKNAKKREKST
ncbi:MAG: transposase [Clostridia bacterium]|nr:transposase [Clostridia bacterium]